MTGKATEGLLDELHGLVAGSLKEQIGKAMNMKDEGGNPVPVPINLILAAMKFLKDNGIDSPARSARMTGLEAQLASIDMDAAAAERFN